MFIKGEEDFPPFISPEYGSFDSCLLILCLRLCSISVQRSLMQCWYEPTHWCCSRGVLNIHMMTGFLWFYLLLFLSAWRSRHHHIIKHYRVCGSERFWKPGPSFCLSCQLAAVWCSGIVLLGGKWSPDIKLKCFNPAQTLKAFWKAFCAKSIQLCAGDDCRGRCFNACNN